MAPPDEIEARAARDNPDIRAALETVNAASHGVSAARAGYLPGLDLDYFYGIDATHLHAYNCQFVNCLYPILMDFVSGGIGDDLHRLAGNHQRLAANFKNLFN